MYNALYHGTSLVIAVFGQKLWIKWGHNPHFLYCGTYKNVAMYDAHGMSQLDNIEVWVMRSVNSLVSGYPSALPQG